jgi:hypothetical protein
MMHAIRGGAAVVLICMVNSSPTLADAIPINSLLSQGYEIKTMASVQAINGSLYGIDAYQGSHSGISAGAIRNFIILQKGTSAYECDNDEAKYINEYRCYSLHDWEKR